MQQLEFSLFRAEGLFEVLVELLGALLG